LGFIKPNIFKINRFNISQWKKNKIWKLIINVYDR
jgi:hypothetical protein